MQSFIGPFFGRFTCWGKSFSAGAYAKSVVWDHRSTEGLSQELPRREVKSKRGLTCVETSLSSRG